MDAREVARAVRAFASFAASCAALAFVMALLSPLALWKASKVAHETKNEENGWVQEEKPWHETNWAKEDERVDEAAQEEVPKTPDILEGIGKQVDLDEELQQVKFWNNFEVERNDPDTLASFEVGSTVKKNMRVLLGESRKHQKATLAAQEVSYHELLQAMGLPTFRTSE